MNTTEIKVAPMPRIFNVYIPKKYRESAIVEMGKLELNDLKIIDPTQYNKLLQNFKNIFPEMVFVDIYKNNIVFFNCKKIIKEVKKYVYKKHGFHILIKKVIVADIDQVQASDFCTMELFEPCHKFEAYTDYPATYIFDEPI